MHQNSSSKLLKIGLMNFNQNSDVLKKSILSFTRIILKRAFEMMINSNASKQKIQFDENNYFDKKFLSKLVKIDFFLLVQLKCVKSHFDGF